MAIIETDSLKAFGPLRPRLLRIAYRMLGSVAEAEDVVQEAWLRWNRADRGEIREPQAFLTRMVTRMCLDVLRSARMRRETYVGPWLPEPLVEAEEDDRDEITLALMLALERLSPLERAAFLLHDVFDVGFDEVGLAIGRNPAACRQLASRARQHVRAARPRFTVVPERGGEIAQAFFRASRSGDTEGLRALLASDVIAYTDGGGKVLAARKPIYGRDKVGRLFAGLARKIAFAVPPLLRAGAIDGLPGFVTLEAGGVLQTTALLIENDLITAIYIVRNPDKLGHLQGLRPAV